VKEPGLGQKLQYDRYPRYSFLDHFLGDEVDLASFAAQSYRETGWFAGARYKTGKPDFSGSREVATVPLARSAEVDGVPVDVEKTFVFERNRAALLVKWKITNRGTRTLSTRFASEVNLSLLAGDADDRYYEIPGTTLAEKKLRTSGEHADATALDLVDHWGGDGKGFRIELRFPKATLWRYGVETVSQSEGGFEATYQGSCVAPVWALELEPGKTVEREIALSFGEV
jgi:alpha-amylase